jgi:hypothetical protein
MPAWVAGPGLVGVPSARPTPVSQGGGLLAQSPRLSVGGARKPSSAAQPSFDGRLEGIPSLAAGMRPGGGGWDAPVPLDAGRTVRAAAGAAGSMSLQPTDEDVPAGAAVAARLGASGTPSPRWDGGFGGPATPSGRSASTPAPAHGSRQHGREGAAGSWGSSDGSDADGGQRPATGGQGALGQVAELGDGGVRRRRQHEEAQSPLAI